MMIGLAGHEDIEAIVALEAEGLAGGWSQQSWQEELSGEDRCVLAARDADGVVVGIATFQQVADVADLHRVIVRADQRRTGIGRQLVLAGIEWACARGAVQMMLEVEESNDAARALYTQTGFEPVARRLDYYGTGRHALVMVRDLVEETDDE